MSVAVTVPPAGQQLGERAVISYGAQRRHLHWTGAAWVTAPEPILSYSDLDSMVSTAHVDPEDWAYWAVADTASALSAAIGEPLRASRPWGWAPRAILDAGAASAAGLVLQVKLISNGWAWEPTTSIDLGLVLYELDPDGWIGPSISPVGHVAAELAFTPTVRCLQSTGWVDAAIPAPTAFLLAPHLYSRFNGGDWNGAWVEYAAAYARWTGVPA